ncbi:MAG: nitrilase-related carbon-nitrogen hydrolase [Candidatus Bipolaricaulaceae bacterium]
MRLGYVQTQPQFGEVERNFARAAALMGRGQADVWVLPELFASGYQFTSRREVRALAEPIPAGETVRRLARLAAHLGCYIAAGLPERAAKRVYNSAVLVGPSGLVAHYRKVHLFYQEKDHFAPGNLPFPVADCEGIKVGLMICFDHLFPEAARTLALRGAEVIAHPANLVLAGVAQLTMRVRALENRVFTVTANRTGAEDRGEERLQFTGRSLIVSPRGEILAQSNDTDEEARAVCVDLALARDKHVTAVNHLLADRRPEMYRG